MSRTYRRKSVRNPYEFRVSYSVMRHFFGRCWWQFDESDIPPSCLQKLKLMDDRRYHSDNYNPKLDTGRAPNWVVRLSNQEFRAVCKRVTKSINLGNYENYIYPLHKQDAGYDYW